MSPTSDELLAGVGEALAALDVDDTDVKRARAILREVLRRSGTHERTDEPECPGTDCAACNGEACGLCGAGLRSRRSEEPCEHDVVQRHERPSPLDAAIEATALIERAPEPPCAHVRTWPGRWWLLGDAEVGHVCLDCYAEYVDEGNQSVWRSDIAPKRGEHVEPLAPHPLALLWEREP